MSRGEIRPEADLLWRGIEAINACIEKLPDMEARTRVLTKLREHLDERVHQCAPESETLEEFLDEHVVVAVVGDNSDLL